jgi:putative membrane protein
MFGYVAGLPAFLAYFATGLVALGAFAAIYSAVTPHHELRLIRTGNVAAVVAFLGAIIGFSLPLASAAANSVSIVDFLIWALVGAIVQGIAFLAAALTMSRLPQRITDGEVSAGIWTAGIAVAVGMLNAACMTY